MDYMQKTIKQDIKAHGIGVHSGRNINIKICPAEINNGIYFFVNGQTIKADFINNKPTPLCTTLINDRGIQIHTVEHFLATTKSLGIDNLNVYVDADEFPIFDGSALPIVQLFQKCEIIEQKAVRKIFKINKEIIIEKDGKMVAFVPSNENKFLIDITCNFSQYGLGITRYIYEASKENFINDIAMCRTFGFWEEAQQIKAAGLAKGSSLDNTVIFKNGKPINENGMRTANEFLKHKILDAIGDTSLCNGIIIGKFIGICPGHALTSELMKLTFSQKTDCIELINPLENLKLRND